MPHLDELALCLSSQQRGMSFLRRTKRQAQQFINIVAEYEGLPLLLMKFPYTEDIERFALELAGVMRKVRAELQKRTRVTRVKPARTKIVSTLKVVFMVPHPERAPPAKQTHLFGRDALFFYTNTQNPRFTTARILCSTCCSIHKGLSYAVRYHTSFNWA